MADRIITSQAVNELLFEGPNARPLKTGFANGATSAATEMQIATGVTGKRLALVWGLVSTSGAGGIFTIYKGTAGAGVAAIMGNVSVAVDVPVIFLPFTGAFYCKSDAGQGLILKYVAGTAGTTSFHGSFYMLN
jgi:hypothetical protein